MAETYVSDQPVGDEDLAAISEGFETAPASAVIRWALETFGDSIALAASFEDIVLIDLATRLAPGIEVVFLDTEAHFPETLAFVEEVRARYDLNLTVTKPGPEREPPTRAAPTSAASSARSSRCAGPRRQARPGSPRSSGPTPRPGPVRPIVGWDASFGLVKVNPLATWTDDDIAVVPGRPRAAGAPAACRRATSPSAAPRPPVRWPKGRTPVPAAGRVLDKSECGLHA